MREVNKDNWESDGMRNGEPIYCPVNGWDCPYFDANGCCMMYPDTDPIDECDDFSTFWEKGDDYVVTIED